MVKFRSFYFLLNNFSKIRHDYGSIEACIKPDITLNRLNWQWVSWIFKWTDFFYFIQSWILHSILVLQANFISIYFNRKEEKSITSIVALKFNIAFVKGGAHCSLLRLLSTHELRFEWMKLRKKRKEKYLAGELIIFFGGGAKEIHKPISSTFEIKYINTIYMDAFSHDKWLYKFVGFSSI